MASIITRKSKKSLVERLADAEVALNTESESKTDEAKRLAALAAEAGRDADTARIKRDAVAQAFEILAANNVDI